MDGLGSGLHFLLKISKYFEYTVLWMELLTRQIHQEKQLIILSIYNTNKVCWTWQPSRWRVARCCQGATLSGCHKAARTSYNNYSNRSFITNVGHSSRPGQAWSNPWSNSPETPGQNPRSKSTGFHTLNPNANLSLTLTYRGIDRGDLDFLIGRYLTRVAPDWRCSLLSTVLYVHMEHVHAVIWHYCLLQ